MNVSKRKFIDFFAGVLMLYYYYYYLQSCTSFRFALLKCCLRKPNRTKKKRSKYNPYEYVRRMYSIITMYPYANVTYPKSTHHLRQQNYIHLYRFTSNEYVYMYICRRAYPIRLIQRPHQIEFLVFLAYLFHNLLCKRRSR